MNETEAHFIKFRNDYEQVVSLLKNGVSENDIPLGGHTHSQLLHVQHKPELIVNFMPIDYYYVIVYAETEKGFGHSDAMTDEGGLKKRLDKHWYLVQRGWM